MKLKLKLMQKENFSKTKIEIFTGFVEIELKPKYLGNV